MLIASPQMLVDETNFGLVLYNLANFYRFEETSSYWSVKRVSVFLCFSLVNQRHTSGFTVYYRTVTNIENTVRAVRSCNSFFLFLSGTLCCDPSSEPSQRDGSAEGSQHMFCVKLTKIIPYYHQILPLILSYVYVLFC